MVPILPVLVAVLWVSALLVGPWARMMALTPFTGWFIGVPIVTALGDPADPEEWALLAAIGFALGALVGAAVGGAVVGRFVRTEAKGSDLAVASAVGFMEVVFVLLLFGAS